MQTAPLLRVSDHTVEITTPAGLIRPVDRVSFDLAAGETLGVVGESGSGKSMLVRSLMRLLPRNARIAPGSTAVFDGRDLARLSRADRRHFWGTRMAMVFQDPMTSLNPVRTIGAQLTDTLRFHRGLRRGAADKRAIELLDRVGIPEPARRLRQYPHELSGGMRQRVTIAGALSCDPELLVADEPTTALDVTVQRQILDLLDELQRERGMAMILISHDLGVVGGHSDRVAVMYAGRFVETAPSGALQRGMAHPYTAALLGSIPRLEWPAHLRLEVIQGRPPDLARLAGGCSFAPRCVRRTTECDAVEPALATVRADHRAACHHPLTGEDARAVTDRPAVGTPA